mmetsp:Transcript_108358/g.302141  ORF Transcript_108358/g.302141 Transcript_108358/m.302141 type:complete len:407 (-) Transcript_108358:344-1564(-)
MPAAASAVVVALVPDALALPEACGVVRLRHRSLADDGDALHSLAGQGQHALVLQEHDGLRGDVAREGRVLGARHVPGEPGLALGRRASATEVQVVDGGQDPPRGLVDVTPWLPLENLRHEPAAGVLALRWAARTRHADARVCCARHVLVRALLQAHGVQCPPIGLHEAAEAQLVLQDPELLLVGAGVEAVLLVVRAHGRRHPGIDGRLERRVVELPRRLRVHDGVLRVAVGLLLVEDPVFHHGHHALRLHPSDPCLRKPRAQVGVLTGEVLKVPAAARHAVHVDGGPQDDVGPLAPELDAERRGVGAHELRVPGGRERELRRPARDGAHQFLPVGPEATRGVLHVQARYAKARDGLGVAHVPPLLEVPPAVVRRPMPADAVQQLVLLLLLHVGQRRVRLLVGRVPR